MNSDSTYTIYYYYYCTQNSLLLSVSKYSRWVKILLASIPSFVLYDRTYEQLHYYLTFIIIIIIIIKSGRQCKASRERFTPYQSKDASPTIQIYNERREKENIRRQKGSEQLTPIEKHLPCSYNLPVPHHRIRVQQHCSTVTLRGE